MHWAQIHCFTKAEYANGKKNDKVVYSIELNRFDQQLNHLHNNMYTFDGSVVPFEKGLQPVDAVDL